jgi:hypothetical protein
MPDLVIAADGGSWARLHLYECWRRIFAGERVRSCTGLAAGFTAALPSQYAGVPVLPISDGSLWQRTVLSGLEIPFLALPQRGTVSASALDLAFYLTGGKIYITGMDLALADIRGHARPYGFDALWEQSASRLNPVYSQTFERALGLRTGGSHGIYASWFSRQLEAWPRRLFSLGKNNPVFAGLGAPDFESGLPGASGFESGLPKQEPGQTRKPFGTLLLKKPENPAKKAAALLAALLHDRRYGGKAAEELSCLLFPGPEPVPLRDLEETIFFLAGSAGRHE